MLIISIIIVAITKTYNRTIKVGIQNCPPLVIIDPKLLLNDTVELDNLMNTRIE